MSSSDRDTNEASPKKKIEWYTKQFQGRLVKRSRSRRLATEGDCEWSFNYCECFQITIRCTNKSMLLRYNSSNRHKS